MGPQLQNQLHHKRLYKQNYKVMIKNNYEQPSAELIVVRFEENMMASDFETKQLQEGNTNWWNDDEE